MVHGKYKEHIYIYIYAYTDMITDFIGGWER